MITKKTVAALALLAAASVPALAQTAAPAAPAAPASPHTFTGNVTLASDYIFRGISQTQHNPAIQGGFDYSHSSGLYLGTWASNVSWVQDGGFKTGSSMEWDFYGGYKLPMGDFTLDLGALQYYYPGKGTGIATLPNTNSTELYVGLSWKFLTLKYNHTVSKNLFGWYNATTNKSTEGSGYWDLSANYDVGSGWGVQGHVGHQTIKHFGAASYTDWKLGVTKDLGFGTVGLAYTGTDSKGKCTPVQQAYCFGTVGAGAKDVGDDRLVLTFSKTF